MELARSMLQCGTTMEGLELVFWKLVTNDRASFSQRNVVSEMGPQCKSTPSNKQPILLPT